VKGGRLMYLVKELIREVKNNIKYSPRKGGYIGNDLTYNIKAAADDFNLDYDFGFAKGVINMGNGYVLKYGMKGYQISINDVINIPEEIEDMMDSSPYVTEVERYLTCRTWKELFDGFKYNDYVEKEIAIYNSLPKKYRHLFAKNIKVKNEKHFYIQLAAKTNGLETVSVGEIQQFIGEHQQIVDELYSRSERRIPIFSKWLGMVLYYWSREEILDIFKFLIKLCDKYHLYPDLFADRQMGLINGKLVFIDYSGLFGGLTKKVTDYRDHEQYIEDNFLVPLEESESENND